MTFNTPGDGSVGRRDVMLNAENGDADFAKFWYWLRMRRSARSITTSPEIVKHIDGLTEANFNLLTKLITWLDANEKAQRKFRSAVLGRLARIEIYGTMTHAAQIVESKGFKPGYEEKIQEHAEHAEEYVAQKSTEMGIAMVKYIYGEDQAPESRHDRRRRWWGWEI